MNKMRYVTCCVYAQGNDIENMVDVAKEIKYATFMKYVNSKELARILTYPWGREEGLRLKSDYHVRYYKSMYKGKPCVFIVHSAIEYIFV